MAEIVPEERRSFDWHDERHDPEGKYRVYCRITDQTKEVMLCTLFKTMIRPGDATISLLQFEKWGISFQSTAIFENQEEINRRVLARFTDICDKQYSSLVVNKERITGYIQEVTGLIGDTP